MITRFFSSSVKGSRHTKMGKMGEIRNIILLIYIMQYFLKNQTFKKDLHTMRVDIIVPTVIFFREKRK